MIPAVTAPRTATPAVTGPVSRFVPWLLVGGTVALVAWATAALVALERSLPEARDPPEQVSFLYVHAATITFGLVGALIIRSQCRHGRARAGAGYS